MARLPTGGTFRNDPIGLGKYTLLCRLASGGMGEVYVAQMSAAAGFEKIVVIKRLLPELSRDAQFVKLFLNEARLTARLSHPNICQVFELAELSGEYYLVMEHLEGLSLVQLFHSYRDRGMDPRIATGLAVQVCEGLAYAHSFRDPDQGVNGVIHRDVSPHNVMLTVSGLVKLLDFGVAKMRREGSQTVTGNAKGKCAYMAPEQLNCEPLDQRVDLFALGVVLFELVSGKRLFRRKSELASMQAIVSGNRPRLSQVAPSAPPELSDVLDRALRVNREERYPNARAFEDALHQAMAAHGGLATLAELARFLEEKHQYALELQRARIKTAIVRFSGAAPKPGELEKTEVCSSMPKHRLPLRAPTMTQSPDSPRPAVPARAPAPAPRGAAEERAEPNSDSEGEKNQMPDAVPDVAPNAAPVAAPNAVSNAASAFEIDTSASASGLVKPRPGELRQHAPAWLLWALVGAAMTLAVGLIWCQGNNAQQADERADMSASIPRTGASAEPDAAALFDAGAAPELDAEPPGSTLADITVDTASPALSTDPSPALSTAASQPRKKQSRERDTSTRSDAKDFGYLTIDATPYAEIYVDNRKVGVTPIVRLELPVGQHTIRARSPTGKEKRLDVRINKNRTSKRRINF